MQVSEGNAKLPGQAFFFWSTSKRIHVGSLNVGGSLNIVWIRNQVGQPCNNRQRIYAITTNVLAILVFVFYYLIFMVLLIEFNLASGVGTEPTVEDLVTVGRANGH